MRVTKLSLAAGAAVLFATVSQADEISVAGYEYKNVLVTKTSSFYYVQIPDEGRTLSIPIGEVPAGTVKINNDPFYRTPLREKYNENRQRRAAGEIKDVDPAFRAAANAPTSSGDASAGAPGGAAPGGGGGAGGFGVPRTAIEQALSQFGFQVESTPTSATAKRPDGTVITLSGPPEALQAITANASGPVATVDAGAQQLQLFVMNLAPGAAGAFGEALAEAKANGSSSKSADGVNIKITRSVSGENATMEMRLSK